jgi:SAM-dependent methyltransferase
MSGPADVPSTIDFKNSAEAEAWTEKAPDRRAFFDAFAASIDKHGRGNLRVLELGSGPGLLAERLLHNHAINAYVMLDFSDAMHDIARPRFYEEMDRVSFETRDFRDEYWTEGLGKFDVIVTQEAAHEVRHKRKLSAFLTQAHDLLRLGGAFLFCDHYSEPGKSARNPLLYFSKTELPHALRKAGFRDVVLLKDEDGMALYRGLAA